MRLTLKIFHLSDEQQRLVDSAMADPDEMIPELLVPYTFYNVDYIKPHGETEWCEIWVGGEYFIANKSYSEVDALIQEQRLIGLN